MNCSRIIAFSAVGANPLGREPFHEQAALLLNKCDGYHHVFARWDSDGLFRGFFDFAGSEPYDERFYIAWALLPDEVPLIEEFTGKGVGF